MILSIVRFFKGGISYDYLSNVPLPEIVEKFEDAEKINNKEKAEMNRASK